MNDCLRLFSVSALAIGFLIPVAAAQKPPTPAPPPPPPTAPPNTSTTPTPMGSQPSESTDELVMFLRGRVVTGDGTPIPNDVRIERICNVGVRQQVYPSANGDFNMQLGSRADSFLDASGGGERNSQSELLGKEPLMGIPRRELLGCELRASASGFRPGTKSLMDLDVASRTADVGTLVVQRTSKVKGMTLNAAPYQAPKEARAAYEKGMEAEKKGHLPEARKYFETAVAIHPRYASAWFELGRILQKDSQKDAAREAYAKAGTIDPKFAQPFVSLAALAYGAGSWTEVLEYTKHVLDLDPWSDINANGYVADLDPVNYRQIYFYEAAANFNLNRIDAAEKSGLKAEHYLDVGTHFLRLHVLMAEIFVRKSKFEAAISELKTYLELAPGAFDANLIRARLAQLQQLNASLTTLP
jgi:Tetratricopeptide repeat